MLERVAAWTGWPLDRGQLARLDRLAGWLQQEAIPAGGLGPGEGGRIYPRHVADSLLFAIGWKSSVAPGSVLDLGSGVGLPGVTLAILWPECRVTLVDRARRRVDLARRLVRVLDLTTVEVVQSSIADLDQNFVADLVVARAVGNAVTKEHALALTAEGGVVVVGGSHASPPPSPSPGEEIVSIPVEILDHPVWLRMMAAGL